MIFGIMLIMGGVGLILFVFLEYKQKKHYLIEMKKLMPIEYSGGTSQAINVRAFYDESLIQKLTTVFRNFHRLLGNKAELKILSLITIQVAISIYLNNKYLQSNQLIVSSMTVIIGTLIFSGWLQSRERKLFEESFPDALTMLASAVSAGEGLMQAIMFVGRTLDGAVGAEFKKMGERLKMGETPDAVFNKSCQIFPYPSYKFFVITMRANIDRGGQIKDVISKLNRIMFNARAVEKKKYALTSEARMSAKIIGVMPLLFLFILQYLSPENFNFVMYDPSGRPILYYVVISEFIGMFIIWSLMKGVK